MADIKTKESVKKGQGGPKKLDRTLILADRMKNASKKTGDYAKDVADDGEVTPDEYAENRIKYAAESAVGGTDRTVKRGLRYGKELRRNHLEKTEAKTERTVEENTAHTMKNTVNKGVRKTESELKQSVKNTEEITKTVNNTRRTVQNTGNAIKTADRTTRTAVKTAEATAKASKKAVEASAKASKKAAEAAREAAIAAKETAIAVGKAVVATCKAIAAGVSKLTVLIGAGGAVAVIIVIVLCLIGGILASCFGLFASSEKSSGGSEISMRDVIVEINEEYQGKLDSITNSTYHEKLEMSGSRAVWPEVLTIYAVKTNTDQDNPQEVATINDEKKQLLKDIFWEMNTISSHSKTIENTEIIETVGENGAIIQTEKKSLDTFLYIDVSHKTAEEMCDKYGFDKSQREQVSEMLSMDSSMWTAVLYGVYDSDEAIVTVALSQIGNIGGQPYWSWYGFGSRVEWCACFVSWCANECGYIDTGIIPKYAACVNGVEWFQSHNQWLDGSAVPDAGMIIFYDWDSPNGESGPQDGSSDHTGIVWKVENGTIYTIEGNYGDSCRTCEHPIGYYEILGYGVPKY